MLKTRDAQRMTPFAVRLKAVKELPMPVPWVYREMLPNDSQATCWCWSLKPIPAHTEDLFSIAVRECIVSPKQEGSRMLMDELETLDRQMSVDRQINRPPGE